MEKYVIPCLDSFKKTLEEINPTSCVQKTLCLEGNQLTVGDRKYLLRKNLYLVAIGKAAIGMIRGAEQVLGQHFISGIASVPDETKMPDEKLQTRILYGAKDNLPDEQALSNSQQIEEFINGIITRAGEKAEEQIFLFLISGGGSALLPAPIPGITLKEKLYLIQLLQHNGADIQQLNILRTALSRLKGGGLARIAYPTKMISLIISDIVGDPIELISSGPTVIPNKTQDPIVVLKDLGILDKINENILNALKRAATKREEDFKENNQNIDVQNVIVASNTKMLEALAKKLSDSNFLPLIITNKLEGNASSRGKEMANLVINLTEENALENELAKKLLFNVETISRLEECLIGQTQPIVLLFGGETTVIFNQDKVQKGAKGGRNQELVLAAFQVLLTHKKDKEKSRFKKEFVLFSLGTDGQDGPTDATGAYISSDELSYQDSMLCSKINDHLEGKNSYGFWNAFNAGQNLIKFGKTGMNVMDIQMIVLLP